ncbi:aspartyl-tRNA synthetase, putative [Theileria equi strain WA]|uniref:aspartate--tRNA ligase n=1 Tax=Theileria equi strain WA TaxID=1537102 RepID=L1LBW3_THEEQ|nr:aspartyl-tRNA synthetase, putative [Theileria equi strain WA]EKX72668.1 aspartyl-tRNA synthetase, putative [Theileria equi strain WA]|eukprot:XP_004832120.1 aspartyl-tRNA synthetase, putative [Theileria equi strain WA]
MGDSVKGDVATNLKQMRISAREQQNIQNQLLLQKTITDYSSDNFGYLPNFDFVLPVRTWVEIKDLNSHVDSNVWIRGRVHEVRGKGALCFLILRQQNELLQCVVDSKSEGNSKDMVKWAASLPGESIVDVFGKVVVPNAPILSTTASCELLVSKVVCISKAISTLPFLIRDANNTDNEEALQNPSVIRVNQDTRLDNRALDLRSFMNSVIFKIQSQVCQLFKSFLTSHGFIEIHTPKLLGGSSEGGASVFKLKYFDSDACLAQSPQLYKQMAICGDLNRVFEIGPVFRAENSNTHRHLCEYVGMDLEMAFKDTYMEVVDLVDSLLKNIFGGLQETCKKELEFFQKNNPSIKPFTWLESTPKFTFREAVDILRTSDVASEIPQDISDYDFSTEHEKLLGKLVKEKFNTDYYIVYEYPLNARPFYTMPFERDGLKLSNSYDFFMRGEEILSGAQRIHDSNALEQRARDCGIDVKTIQSYVDVFKYGAPPHAGVGIGLERVVMLFLGLGNIRKTSMFPRDPKRLTP